MTTFLIIASHIFCFCLGIVFTTQYLDIHKFVAKVAIIQTAPTIWESNHFICSDIEQKDKEGNISFYSTKVIDEWKDRINKELSR